ncbi:MAG: DUF4743 domain-containing protein [Rhodospirillaceae bacterium]
MALIDHIRQCNTHELSRFVPFSIGAYRVGWVRPTLQEALLAYGEVFQRGAGGDLLLAPPLSDPATTAEDRDKAVGAVIADLVDQNVLPTLKGEMYRVVPQWGQPRLMSLDRHAVPAFGVRGYGVHLNVFRRDPDGLKMWIARRSADRVNAPNKLDNLVAGGQPDDLGLDENLIKEAAEEAGMPAVLAQNARPVGAVTYCMEAASGLKPDTLFCYDLEVPEGFTPVNTDGEVSEVMLLPIDAVLDILRSSDAFKYNVTLVIIDFLIRHGILNPDTEPDYEALLAGLHGWPGQKPPF